MLRKILAAGAVALAGLVMFGGVASADVDYGADPNVALNSTDSSVESGSEFDVYGDGFLPGETVGVTATYGTPSGLRASRALATLSSPQRFTAVADSNGHFSKSVSYDQVGTITFVATGQTSGRTASTVVHVGAAGSVSTTTVVAAADWSGSSDGVTGGLASTGASVAGPIAIGLGALLAGLALLFFGTRGVIRHKGARTNTTV